VLGEQCRCPQCGTLARVKNCKSNPAQNNILDHIQQLERELLNSDSSSDFGDDDYPDGREQQLAACKDEQFTSGRRRKSAQMAMANVRTLYEQTAEWSAPISSGTQSTANGPNIIITDTTQLKQAHIIFSGVCVKERRQLEQKLTALKLPVKISFGDEFDGSTHLVVKCNEDGLCGRTSKYLLSILSHRWILRIDWLLDIVRTCKWQPEELYEVCGVSLYFGHISLKLFNVILRTHKPADWKGLVDPGKPVNCYSQIVPFACKAISSITMIYTRLFGVEGGKLFPNPPVLPEIMQLLSCTCRRLPIIGAGLGRQKIPMQLLDKTV
jgi:hypothetical protein